MKGVLINDELNQIIGIDDKQQLAFIEDDTGNSIWLSKEQAQIVSNFLERWLSYPDK